jgi:hypothetical protein
MRDRRNLTFGFALGIALTVPLWADTGPATKTGSPPTNAPSTAAPTTAAPASDATHTADASDDAVAPIFATKKCDQVGLSPDKLWLAATRTYAAPPRNAIWKDDDSRSCLLVREVEDGGNLGSDFIYWEEPTLDIVKFTWSPDSRFLVIVCTAANGDQPWAFLVLVLDLHDRTLHNTDPLGTIVSKEVKFLDSGHLQLNTGEPSAPTAFDFDLDKHIGDLPVMMKFK